MAITLYITHLNRSFSLAELKIYSAVHEKRFILSDFDSCMCFVFLRHLEITIPFEAGIAQEGLAHVGVGRTVHFWMESVDYRVVLPLVELKGADLFVFLAEKSRYVLGFSNFNIVFIDPS